VPLGPAQVHPEEHLGPVGGLGAAGARADREECAARVVLAREEEGGPLPLEVGGERRPGLFELCRQLRIGGFLDELERREEVVGPPFEAGPQLDLGPQAVRFTEDLLRRSLVVPEAGLGRQRLELRGAPVL
jgi:hypothetical protein